MTEEELEEYFRAYVTETGQIGPKEFRDICAQFGIASKEADVLFNEMDYKKKGKISIDVFTSEYRNYLGNDTEKKFSKSDMMRRKSDARLAWSQLIAGIGESVVKKSLNNSGKKLEELYHELQNAGSPPELVTQFEKTLSSLLQDVKRLHDDNQKLEQMFNKEKEVHSERMRDLEEELDAQVAKIEAEIKEQARLENEQVKKEMQLKLEAEKAELLDHLRFVQKANNVIMQKKEENSNLKLKHVAAYENEELRCLLSDTRTNLALLHAEMAQIKSEYETKCRELNNHQDAVVQYVEQNKHVRRQLSLLQEANKNLQDTNDGLLTVMGSASGRMSPYCISRAGSDSDSSEKFHTIAASVVKPSLLTEQTHDSGAQYVIQRLMEDIDSGRSTLRDPIECDSDHKSLQEEFSDAESQLKSLESNDSNNSRARTHKSDNLCMTPISIVSCDTTGDPDRTYKVVLAGDAAVGKSCFIHRFCKGNFAHRLGSTLGVDFQIKTIRVDEKNIALQLWDTAGQERFRAMTKTYFRRADGVVLLYDVTSERSFLNIREWIQSINECADKEIPILICGNKLDLREAARQMGANCVETKHGEDLAKSHKAIFFETSSKTGRNIFDALISISREMLLREDVEVQTSALQISQANKPMLTCCGG